jgi:hypothetical protein
MARGRKTGGRRKGSRNKITIARESEIASSGLTPLDYMLSIIRNSSEDPGRRLDAAKSAAPYCHHRLSSIDHNIDRTRNPDGGEVIIEVGFGKDPEDDPLGPTKHPAREH